MKKILIFIITLIIIPFLIVTFFNRDKKSKIEEIKLNYVSNIIVRVYRKDKDIIENVFLEEYVVGVVAGEMPVSFSLEALKAQAVASRTYVLRKIIDNSDNDYDVVDTVMDQVYLDDEFLKDSWGDNYTVNINKIREAVNNTSMEYLCYDDTVINAMYFSTSNGYTEDYEVIFGSNIPYLVSVESFWDKDISGAYYNTRSISLGDFYRSLGISYSNSLIISNVIRSDTGRVISLDINGINFKGRDLYTRLGLRSYDFSISLVLDTVKIVTYGYGHGVGMSQYGAYGMALDGYSYKDILFHYYTNTYLKKWDIN